MKNKKNTKIKKNKTDVLSILFFIFMFILGISMSFLSAYYTYAEPLLDTEGNITASLPTHNLVISYEGLTKNEINKANLYINDLNSIYMTDRQKEIRFVKNITSYCNDCVGLNYNDGDLMVILYRESETETKYTLCHEALHSYLYGSEDVEEPLVRDISQTMVCFKHERELIW